MCTSVPPISSGAGVDLRYNVQEQLKLIVAESYGLYPYTNTPIGSWGGFGTRPPVCRMSLLRCRERYYGIVYKCAELVVKDVATKPPKMGFTVKSASSVGRPLL